MRVKLLSVYCVSHFLVDLCCAFFMFSQIFGTDDWISAMLIYNFCAFALQMPFGLAADRISKNALIAALGCILVAVSVFIPASITFASVLGIGNALFHVGGGIDVLNMSDRKCAPLGLFVSPGAIGLCIGRMLTGQMSLYIASVLLIAAAAVILITSKAESNLPQNAPLKIPRLHAGLLLSLVCLFAVVCLRSFAGMSFSFEWKSAMPSIVSVCCIALGKALGGLAADAIGSKKTSVISLLLCAVLFLFSHIPLCGLAALLLFNMTMPITLWETSRLFPNAKGFSFGLLTFALFTGFLPVLFGAPALSSVFSAAVSVISLALLLTGLRRGGHAA